MTSVDQIHIYKNSYFKVNFMKIKINLKKQKLKICLFFYIIEKKELTVSHRNIFLSKLLKDLKHQQYFILVCNKSSKSHLQLTGCKSQ